MACTGKNFKQELDFSAIWLILTGAILQYHLKHVGFDKQRVRAL
jgi:hypothetical protein